MGPSGRRRGGASGLAPGAAGLILAGALLGALLLIVAEFTPLYTVAAPGGSVFTRVGTGSNHGYALVPMALLAALLAVAVRRGGGGRAAILAIGLLGAVALVIALAIDLPDAHRSGVIVHLRLARAKPSTGLYLETLGAVVLLASCGSGLLLAGRPARPDATGRPAGSDA